MRFLFFALFITLGFVSCKSTETEEPQQTQQTQETQEVASSRGISTATFKPALKDVIKALKNQDKAALDGYIDSEKGLFFILSTQGAYSECLNYEASAKLFEYSANASEYEANPLKYLLDYLNNVDMSEIEIIEKDLVGVESCSFHEKGFFVDSNESDIKLLTDIYQMNSERDGLGIEANELLKLGDAQKYAAKTVYISDGEVAYTFYFTEKDGQWTLTIMDMRDCDT
jgi:Ni,Fe-hydrogenase I large subunit